jgi:hypothetical protein
LRGNRRHCGRFSVVMKGQRIMAKRNQHIVAVSFFDLFESRTDPCAVRSLKVAVGNYRHLCFGRIAQDWCPF